MLLLLQLTIPFIQAQDRIPKFEFFTIHPKFTSTLSPRNLTDGKSEVTEAPEIPDKTFPENSDFKFFKNLGVSKFKVPKVPEITSSEHEKAVSDVLVHHFDRIRNFLKRLSLGNTTDRQHRFSDLTILFLIWVGTYECMKNTLNNFFSD